jgi:hypothetical protein
MQGWYSTKSPKEGARGKKMGKKGPHRYNVTVKDAVIWVITQISVLGHDTELALYDRPQMLTSKEILIISQYFYTQIQIEFQT